MRLKESEFNKIVNDINTTISDLHKNMTYDILVRGISSTKVGENNGMSRQAAHKQAAKIYKKYVELYGVSKFPVVVKPGRINEIVDHNLQIQQTKIDPDIFEAIKKYSRQEKQFLQDVYKTALIDYIDYIDSETTHKPSSFYKVPPAGKTINIKISEGLKDRIVSLAEKESVSERSICYSALIKFHHEHDLE